MAVASRERPADAEAAAALLAACAAGGGVACFAGGGTKPWGGPGAAADVEISTAGLDAIVEHNEGDLTAVLEAGVPLATAQARFAGAGQRLMLDPPLGAGDAATVGGMLSAGDSGPLRHRYGAPRDLVLGVRVALSDGTLARSGGKVIKNVAGYDLAKLVTGAFGTLGLVCEVAVRLHPLPRATATVVVEHDDPDALSRVAATLAHARIETESLDVRWEAGAGAVLARYAGAAAGDLAAAAQAALGGAGEIATDDGALWDAQRADQRSSMGGLGVRVSCRAADLARVLRAADAAHARAVGRAALGLSWLVLPPAPDDVLAAAVNDLRAALTPYPCAVLDAPPAVRAALDPWDGPDGAELELMRRVKARFDPAGACNRGRFVGGI